MVMLVRDIRLQQLIAALLVALVAMSAQAWASHVDWPTTRNGEHAHVDISAFDVNTTTAVAQGADSGHSDHCCHAAAHLVGLRSRAEGVAFQAAAAQRIDHRSLYTSVAHAPLIDPPIA